MSLSYQLDVLKRRWLTVSLLALVGMLVGLLYSVLQTPLYESEQTVYISASDPSGDTSRAYQGSLLSAQKIKSYIELAQSSTVLEPADRELGRLLDPSHLSVDSESNTVLMEVSYRDSSIEGARAATQAVSNSLVRLIAQLEQPKQAGAQPTISAQTVNDPTLPTERYSPDTLLNVFGGLVLGLLGGVGIAVTRDALDQSVRSRDHVQSILDTPYLGEVPADSALSAAPLSGEQRTATDERIRQIRTNLQFVDVDSSSRRILVSSAVPGEGKTTLACNLAKSMAQDGFKVLLVDADLRIPRVAGYMGLESAVGLTSFLSHRMPIGDIIQQLSPNLSVVTSGPLPPNPTEILGSHQMRSFLDQLMGFDFVLLDSPPINPVADSSVLIAITDGVLVAVRENTTLTTELEQLRSQVDRVSGQMFGFVLTRTTKQKASAYSSYYSSRQASHGARLDSPPTSSTSTLNKAVLPSRPSPRPRRQAGVESPTSGEQYPSERAVAQASTDRAGTSRGKHS